MWMSIDPFMRIYMVKGSKIRPPIELNKAIDGGLAGRPDTRIAENLYVVGAWVGKECLLSNASVASAKRASKLITKG
jgi:NADPH-dependent curcumin reductase CurA